MTINKPNNAESQTRKFKLAPDYAGSEPRVAHDLEQAGDLVKLLDKERGIDANPLTTSPDWEGLNVCFLSFFLFSIHIICISHAITANRQT